ncbi:MAG: hypothetical protein J7M38_07660, partial [Armatimonadetes bacterium]|nr:hypothetical protein [Armatimonadota bacterium]
MEPLKARKIRIFDEVNRDPRAADRARRLADAIDCDDVAVVDEAGLNEVAQEIAATPRPRHGMSGDIEPIVIFNVARLNESDDERERRKERYPELFALGGSFPLSGTSGFTWRASGSPEHREKTGQVCQPAWQIHSIWGCHYRCAYCSLGHYINLMMNLEQFVDTLDEEIATHAPDQRLFQYDNGTDLPAFEPEYGGSQLLVEYFADRPGQFLELYVGKSASVDFLLDLDHRGHTVCCWSLAGLTQSTRFERVAADMHQRIEAARKCQEAGYHVRMRFSPFIPVRNWREECTEMIEALFADVQPDVITFETIRFMGYEAIMRDFDPDLLDPEFVEVMAATRDTKTQHGEEVPMDYRRAMYRYIIDELERVSPQTPYAFCREARTTWEYFADDFGRHRQHPD